MAATDEEALICDFAETYYVMDYTALPCGLAATLAAGLRNDSRSKMQLASLRVTPEALLLAVCADRLSTLVWFQTKDGQKGRNRPKSIAAALSEGNTAPKLRSYSTGAEFDAAWARLIAAGEEG